MVPWYSCRQQESLSFRDMNETFIEEITCILFASTNYGRGEVDGGICKIILATW